MDTQKRKKRRLGVARPRVQESGTWRDNADSATNVRAKARRAVPGWPRQNMGDEEETMGDSGLGIQNVSEILIDFLTSKLTFGGCFISGYSE